MAVRGREARRQRWCDARPMIGDLLQGSLREEGVYDELSENGIDPRPHWTQLIESLRLIGPEELGRRWARAERRIRENGVSYNVYGDALGANRPWRLDLIPFLLPAHEWQFIEAGIIQRAEVLELLLADLYGPQELLKEGRVPPELLFANPAFLRPVAGMKNGHGSFLHLIAVDLARSPDGQWWVLADRTQAPSGAGYAIENRTLVADVLPEIFQSSNVHRLAHFFRAQREALARHVRTRTAESCLTNPWTAQRNVFRTFLPGSLSRIHARRRWRISRFGIGVCT